MRVMKKVGGFNLAHADYKAPATDGAKAVYLAVP